MIHEFRLPDLGEGLHEAVLVAWKVQEGDVVQQDQPLAEVETDKALSELPSPCAGRVLKLHWQPGDVIPVGAVVVTLEHTIPEGVRTAAGDKEQEPAAVAVGTEPVQEGSAHPERLQAEAPVLAAPATRRLAREHGVDLRLVRGTGPGGRITQEDVLSYVAARAAAQTHPAAESVAEVPFDMPPGVQRPVLPDFSRWGPIERQPATPIRRRIAQRMMVSFHTTAPVTHMDEADVSLLEDCRRRLRLAGSAAPKLSILPFVVRAAVSALQQFPLFNASFDDDRQEIIFKKYWHIGIAVDSPQGLLVPVVRDADRKTILELAQEIARLADLARSGKIRAEDMRGGTFTITNIGALGGTAFTPIINWPEVAILGCGRIREHLALHQGSIAARLVLPLILTFDHRVLDGAQAARFLNAIKERLENPLALFIEVQAPSESAQRPDSEPGRR